MDALDAQYQKRLDAIAENLLNSEILEKYLDEEEEEDFQALRDAYEPQIAAIHEEVASNHPLQLIAFEQELFDPKFEGVFLPKLLGYSVLRGQLNEHIKYTHPQNHFKDVLLAICNSSNFDYLKKRIGQSIQVGFSMSSDIWITNLINDIPNKRIRYFLLSQKIEKYRIPKERMISYRRYANQFKNDNFYTTPFPTNTSELKVLYPELKIFINRRIQRADDNTSLIPSIKRFLDTPEFQGTKEHLELMGLYAAFFDRNEEDEAHLKSVFNQVKNDTSNFDDLFFDYQIHTLKSDLNLDGNADKKVSALLDKSNDDRLSKYFALMDIVHNKGYVHEDSIEAIKVFYNQHAGLSIENECIRFTILRYISTLINNLEATEYSEFFKIAQIFPIYINIFGIQQFNKDLKDLSMKYVKKLLKKYVDKRGKDYQDIKKFVSTTFLDLAFLKQKEIVELFKTRRKKKKPTAA